MAKVPRNPIGFAESVRELCSIWRADAERIRRYDPTSQAASFLIRCAEDAEKILHDSAPEWIPIGTVEASTGWGRKKLRREFRELAQEKVPGTGVPLARLSPRWEIHRSALDRIQPKPGRALELGRTDDLEALSRKLAAEGEV